MVKIKYVLLMIGLLLDLDRLVGDLRHNLSRSVRIVFCVYCHPVPPFLIILIVFLYFFTYYPNVLFSQQRNLDRGMTEEVYNPYKHNHDNDICTVFTTWFTFTILFIVVKRHPPSTGLWFPILKGNKRP